MINDATRLFDEDRQRFLTLFREFLQNTTVPDQIKTESVATTLNVLRQMRELVGPKHG